MPAWPATNVMMLGKLRPSERTINDPTFIPQRTIDYIPTNTTSLPGQNVLRQVVMNGVHGLRGGMGAVGLGATSETLEVPTVAQQYAAMPMWWKISYGVLVTASGAASLYHGYKRNGNSLGWGLGWFVMGSIFPVITPTVAFAQGFGKRKGR